MVVVGGQAPVEPVGANTRSSPPRRPVARGRPGRAAPTCPAGGTCGASSRRVVSAMQSSPSRHAAAPAAPAILRGAAHGPPGARSPDRSADRTQPAAQVHQPARGRRALAPRRGPRPRRRRGRPPGGWPTVRHSNQAAASSTSGAPVTRPSRCGTRVSWPTAGRPGDASQSATGPAVSDSTLSAPPVDVLERLAEPGVLVHAEEQQRRVEGHRRDRADRDGVVDVAPPQRATATATAGGRGRGRSRTRNSSGVRASARRHAAHPAVSRGGRRVAEPPRRQEARDADDDHAAQPPHVPQRVAGRARARRRPGPVSDIPCTTASQPTAYPTTGSSPAHARTSTVELSTRARHSAIPHGGADRCRTVPTTPTSTPSAVAPTQRPTPRGTCPATRRCCARGGARSARAPTARAAAIPLTLPAGPRPARTPSAVVSRARTGTTRRRAAARARRC